MQRGKYELPLTLLGLAGAGALVWFSAQLIAEHLPALEDLFAADVATPGTQFLEVDGDTVAYRTMGHGPRTMLLIHGFSCDLTSWDALQPMLARSYRTVAIDLWGFGASARPPRLTPADWTWQVIAVMDVLNIPAATLIGHSMGGRVVLNCAAQYPERVPALALIDSDGFQRFPPHLFLRAYSGSPFLRVTLRRLRQQPGELVRYLRRSYGRDYPITDDMIQRYLRPLYVRGTEACWSHIGRSYPGTDLLETLSGVRCPSLLIWGADDKVTPVHFATRLMEALPQAELRVIPHVEHLPHEQCPERVYEYLQEFVNCHATSG